MGEMSNVESRKTSIIKVIIAVVLTILFMMWWIPWAKSFWSEPVKGVDSELQVWKDKDGLNHAKIQILESNSLRDFTSLKTKDSLITELQEEVKTYKNKIKHGGSVTILEGETKYDTTFITTGLSKDSLSILLPYQFSRKDKWIDYSFNIKRDRTDFTLKINNKYTIVLGEEKQGLFKPRKSFVEVVSKNPYNTTKSLRTYQKTFRDKPFTIGAGVYYGLGADLRLQPMIGFGIQKTILRF